jgi:hypothetical protein
MTNNVIMIMGRRYQSNGLSGSLVAQAEVLDLPLRLSFFKVYKKGLSSTSKDLQARRIY